MKESQIAHEGERGNCWVLENRNNYAVMVNGITHSSSETNFEKTAAGLSLAKARCDYLDRRLGKA